MNSSIYTWNAFLKGNTRERQLWLRNMAVIEANSEVEDLKTRIDVPGPHILIRQGQKGSVVVTFSAQSDLISYRNPDLRRSLLSISFDTLCDWHVVLEPSKLTIYNNRISGDTLIKDNVGHEELPPHLLGEILSEKKTFKRSHDFQDITDRILERISELKKMLSGYPENPRLKNSEDIDHILNAAIFLRFVEDYEKATNGKAINLQQIMKTEKIDKFYQLISHVFSQIEMDNHNNLFEMARLRDLPDKIDEIIFDWLYTSYRDPKQGRYEYDFSLIAKHSMSQIYDKYISLVSYHTQNGKLSLWPEYNTELYWRRGLGLLYTPEYIARFIVGQVLKNYDESQWSRIRISDMACGSGIFLKHFLLAIQAKEHITNGITTDTLRNIEAFDVNKSAVASAKLNIAMISYIYRNKVLDGFEPKEANTLSAEFREQYSNIKPDLILMNPPFRGYEQQQDPERKLVKEVLGNYYVGRADYSTAFLKIALDRLHDNGCLGIIMPASFLESDYAKRLRSIMAKIGKVQLVAKFEEYTLFKRVEVQICILIYHKHIDKARVPGTKVLYCRNAPEAAIRAVEMDLFDARNEWDYFIADERGWGEKWNLMPKELSEIFQELRDRHSSVSRIFDVRQGIRIGKKAAYIIFDRNRYSIKHQEIIRPIADDENIFNGRLYSDVRGIIYAYDKDGVLSSQEMQHYPEILSHLEEFRDQLKSRARMRQKEIWELAEPREYELLFSPKIVSSNFGLAGSYAFDEHGLYAITNGSFLVPRIPFVKSEAWYFYLAILNSDFYLKLVSRRSRKLKGGQYDLDSRFTKSIPVPLFDSIATHLRENISLFGRNIHQHGLSSVNDIEYNELVLDAYGLDINHASLF